MLGASCASAVLPKGNVPWKEWVHEEEIMGWGHTVVTTSLAAPLLSNMSSAKPKSPASPGRLGNHSGPTFLLPNFVVPLISFTQSGTANRSWIWGIHIQVLPSLASQCRISTKNDLSFFVFFCFFWAFLHIMSSNPNYVKIPICRPLEYVFTYMLKYFHDFRNLFEIVTGFFP